MPEDNARLVKETIAALGGLDVIIANAGMCLFCYIQDESPAKAI